MSLIEARLTRDTMRARLLMGLDAIAPKEDITVQSVGAEWYTSLSGSKEYSKKHLETISYRLDHYIYPSIGHLFISKATRQMITGFLVDIAKKGKGETAKRVSGITAQIFAYAYERGYINNNPAENLARALPSAPKQEHFASTKEEDELSYLLCGIDNVQSIITRTALTLAAYCFPRCGEMLLSTWGEFDLKQGLWTIPAEHTKRRRELKVPLPKQITSLLSDLQKWEKNNIRERMGKNLAESKVFLTTYAKKEPNTAINEAALLKVLNDITKKSGGKVPKVTIHGFRHTASTILHSQGVNTMYIEHQLAHLDPNRIRDTYNSYDFLKERRDMLQQYADYLDGLKSKARAKSEA